ncbi:MAG: nitroreductase family protein [Victivallaceae bacterium]
MEFEYLLTGRRTVRRFKQVQVLQNEIESMLNAARLASCGGNMQRLRYIVIRNKSTVEQVLKHTAWAGFVTPARTPAVGKNAPLTFIAVTSQCETNNVLHTDAGAAIQSMELAAWNIGVGCCWIGAFKQEDVRKALALPENICLLYLVAIGYPDESPVTENIPAGESTKYYLDADDVLHVPKYSIDAITEWR